MGDCIIVWDLSLDIKINEYKVLFYFRFFLAWISVSGLLMLS